jgi:ABC-type branched-subunit amino acid transport system permease subunit
LKRFGIGLLCGVAGYIVVALASYFLIEQFSSNQHDRELEAAMTSVFFFGPMGAVLAFVVGVVVSRRSTVAPPTER